MLGVVSPSSNTMKTSPAFPSIEESHNEHEDHHEENNNNTVNVVDSDWEMLSHASSILSRNKTLKHCASSPDFSFYGHTNDINIISGSEEASEEDSAFSSYADNFTIDTEVSDLVMVNGDTITASTPDGSINSGSAVPQTPTSTPMKQKPMKKVPSFKDAILLNSQEKEKEARLLKEQEEKRLSGTNKQRRPFQRAKFVVKNVTGTKRCPRSASVPNLQSLAIVDEEDYDGGGGGGCGGGGGDDEILGMSDASDYYARKKHGSVTYKQGQKLRPDEAKRKKMIMYKKNLQRQGR